MIIGCVTEPIPDQDGQSAALFTIPMSLEGIIPVN